VFGTKLLQLIQEFMAYVFEIALSRSMNTYHKWSVCSIYSTYTRSMSKMRTLFACMLSLASASKDRERWPIYTRRTWCFYIFCNNICGNILRNKHVVGGNTNRVCFCYQTYVVKLPRKKQQRIIVCVHLELFFLFQEVRRTLEAFTRNSGKWSNRALWW